MSHGKSQLSGLRFHQRISKRQHVGKLPPSTDGKAPSDLRIKNSHAKRLLDVTPLHKYDLLASPNEQACGSVRERPGWNGWQHRRITPSKSISTHQTPLELAARAATSSIFGSLPSPQPPPTRVDGWIGTAPLVSAFLSAVHGHRPHNWQRELLPHVASGGDMLVATGTGTGKSAIADAAWASALDRSSHTGGVAVISAPLLAVVEQIGARARTLAHMGGWSVREVGGKRDGVARAPVFIGDGADALVCTTHKLERVVWEALVTGSISRLCCVVVDEAHAISQDSHAGVALETALTLLLHLRSLTQQSQSLIAADPSSLTATDASRAAPHQNATPSRNVASRSYKHPSTLACNPQLVLLSASLPTQGPSARAFTRWLGDMRTARVAARPLALTQLAVCVGGSASGPGGVMVKAGDMMVKDRDGWVHTQTVDARGICGSMGIIRSGNIGVTRSGVAGGAGCGYIGGSNLNLSRTEVNVPAPTLFELLHAGAVAVALEACVANAPAFLFAGSRKDVGGYVNTIAKRLPRVLCGGIVSALGNVEMATQFSESLSTWTWVSGFQPRMSRDFGGVGRGFPLRVFMSAMRHAKNEIPHADRTMHALGGDHNDSSHNHHLTTMKNPFNGDASVWKQALERAIRCLTDAAAQASLHRNGSWPQHTHQHHSIDMRQGTPASDGDDRDVTCKSGRESSYIDDVGDRCVRVFTSDAAVALLRARARLLWQLCRTSPSNPSDGSTSPSYGHSTHQPLNPTMSLSDIPRPSLGSISPISIDDWCVESVDGPSHDDAVQLERLCNQLCVDNVTATRVDSLNKATTQQHPTLEQERDMAAGSPLTGIVWLDVRHLALPLQAAIAASLALTLSAERESTSTPNMAHPQGPQGDTLSPRSPQSNGLCLSALGTAIALGIGAHNAGMSYQHRDLMHQAFARPVLSHSITADKRIIKTRTGVLSALVCTATVATGVDAPVAISAVLGSKVAGQPMSGAHYRQAIGRAGRRDASDAAVEVFSLESDAAMANESSLSGDSLVKGGGSAPSIQEVDETKNNAHGDLMAADRSNIENPDQMMRDYVEITSAARTGRSILFCEHPCRVRSLADEDAVDAASLSSAMNDGAWASLLCRWVAVRHGCDYGELLQLAERSLWAVSAMVEEEDGGQCAACAVQRQVDTALSLLVTHMALFATSQTRLSSSTNSSFSSTHSSFLSTRPHTCMNTNAATSPFHRAIFHPGPTAYASLYYGAPILDVLTRWYSTNPIRRHIIVAPGAAEIHAFAASLPHKALLEPFLRISAPALMNFPKDFISALGMDLVSLDSLSRLSENSPRQILPSPQVKWLEAFATVYDIYCHLKDLDDTNSGASKSTGVKDDSIASRITAAVMAALSAQASSMPITPSLVSSSLTLDDVLNSSNTKPATPASASVDVIPSLQQLLTTLQNTSLCQTNTAALCAARAHGANTLAISRASGHSRAALTNLWQAAAGVLRVTASEAMLLGDRTTALVLSNIAARVRWEKER